MRTKLSIALLFAFLVGLLGACIVHSHGNSYRRGSAGGCAKGYYHDNGWCHKKGPKVRDHRNDGGGGGVTVRDNRR